jgi:hypothetical protein
LFFGRVKVDESRLASMPENTIAMALKNKTIKKVKPKNKKQDGNKTGTSKGDIQAD